MNKLSRRAFSKLGLSILLLPSLVKGGVVHPAVLAGQQASEDEQGLATRFLATHEKNMAPLRAHDLPNNVPPAIIFTCHG